MNTNLSKSLRRLFFFAGVFTALLLTLSILSVFLNSYEWWFVALLSLLFPVLFLITAAFFFIWIFINPRQSLAFAIPLLLSIHSLRNTFALNNVPAFTHRKAPGSIRIITWNVGLFNLTARNSTIAEKNNAAIFKQLKALDADVICMQEFFTAVVPGTQYNFLDSVSKTLGYPYYYFSRDIPYFSNQFFSGNIIYSKHKIIDSSHSVFSETHFGGLLRATVKVEGNSIDIFTSRLRSVNFDRSEYETIDNMKKISDPRLRGTGNLLRKLRVGYRERNGQLKIVTADLAKSNRPSLFAGDLNDVPTGNAYATLKKQRNDVWLSKGMGIGRTFKYISPTLRIDYIFPSEHFETLQTKRIISIGSDHYGLVTDIKLKREAE